MGIKKYLLGINRKQLVVTLIGFLLLGVMWGYYNFISPSLTLSGTEEVMKDIKEVKLVNKEKTYIGNIHQDGKIFDINFKKDYQDNDLYQLVIVNSDGSNQIISEPLSLSSNNFLTYSIGVQSTLTKNESGKYIVFTTKDFSNARFNIILIMSVTAINMVILIFDWFYLSYIYRRPKVKMQIEIMNAEKIKKVRFSDNYTKTIKTLVYDNLRKLIKNDNGNRLLLLDTRLNNKKHRLSVKISYLDNSESSFILDLPKNTPVINLTINPLKDLIIEQTEKSKLPQVIHPFKITESKI